MMIYEFPMEDFIAYLQWFSDTLGNKKMFLSLDYPTLRLWIREFLQIFNFQEVHHLALVPQSVLLSTFGYLQVQQFQAALIELVVIVY